MSYSGNFVNKSKIENSVGSCSIDQFGNTIASSNLLPVGDISVGGGDISYGINQDATLKIFPVSGTDTDGKNLTISAGQGTGTGAGGNIVFQTADGAVSTGSGVNSLITAMTILDDGSVGIGTTPLSGTITRIEHDQAFSDITGGALGNLPCQLTITDGEQRLHLGAYYEGGVGQTSTLQATQFSTVASLSINPRGGFVAVNKVGPAYQFDVNGDINTNGTYRNVSDDRIKYNETSIDGTEALSIISQLKPEKYEKITQEPNDNINLGTWIPTDSEWNDGAKNNFSWDIEAGLIAQDVRSITELEFCVKGQEVDDEGNQTLLQVNYNSIYAYHIAATKALSTKVSTLETQVADLLSRLSVLENP